MAGLNRVMLIGNLCGDPEARSLNNGGEVVSFRLATNESWKDKDGNRQERAEFHSVVVFNEGLAKIAKSYLRKGSRCFVEGQLQTRKWTDQSGNDRYSTEVVLQRFRGEIVLLDGKQEGGAEQRGAEPRSRNGDAPRSQPSAFDSDLDDDVPF